MPEEQFQTHLTSLIVKKSEKPKKIGERMVRIWSEISSHHYNFDRQAIEVAELGTVTKAEVIEYYQVQYTIAFYSFILLIQGIENQFLNRNILPLMAVIEGNLEFILFQSLSQLSR